MPVTIAYESYLADKIMELLPEEEPWVLVPALELIVARLREKHGITSGADQDE